MKGWHPISIHSTVTYLISCRTDTHVWTMKCLPCYNNYWEHFSPFVFSFWFRVLICSFMCRVFFRSKMVINTLTMLCPALYPSLSFLSSESFFMRACLFVLWVVSSWACLFVHCIKSLGFFMRLPHDARCVVFSWPNSNSWTHELLRENLEFYYKHSFDYWKQDVHSFI